MTKWYAVRNLANGAGEVALYGDIGTGVTLDSFLAEVRSLGKPKNLTLRINSDGGDVITGFAIFNKIREMRGQGTTVVATVEGIAASIASVIPMAADEIRMPQNAMLMIHNPWGMAGGDADQIRSFADALDNMRDSIVSAYVDRSGLSESKVAAMMDEETWLSAAKAVELGLADRVIDPINMQARATALNLTRFGKVPASFGRSTDAATIWARRNAIKAMGLR